MHQIIEYMNSIAVKETTTQCTSPANIIHYKRKRSYLFLQKIFKSGITKLIQLHTKSEQHLPKSQYKTNFRFWIRLSLNS